MHPSSFRHGSLKGFFPSIVIVRSFVGSLGGGLLLGGKGEGDGLGDGFGCGAFCAAVLALTNKIKKNKGAQIFLFMKISFEPFAQLDAITFSRCGIFFNVRYVVIESFASVLK